MVVGIFGGPFGIQNATNVTLQNITDMGNFTDPTQFFVKVNTVVYNGWLFFLLLIALWFISFRVQQIVRDDMLVNAMYASAFITVLAFFIRAIQVVYDTGEHVALLSDGQLWIFPILTVCLMLVVYVTKDG